MAGGVNFEVSVFPRFFVEFCFKVFCVILVKHPVKMCDTTNSDLKCSKKFDRRQNRHEHLHAQHRFINRVLQGNTKFYNG